MFLATIAALHIEVFIDLLILPQSIYILTHLDFSLYSTKVCGKMECEKINESFHTPHIFFHINTFQNSTKF